MVNITINHKEISVPEGITILEAAKANNFNIPTLCYLKDINEIGACRMCLVEVEGNNRLVASCNTPVEEGMVIYTHSKRVMNARRINLRYIMSQHDARCPSCPRNNNCSLQELSSKMNMRYSPYGEFDKKAIRHPNFPIVKNNNKCIQCMRCINICDKVQGMHIWDIVGSGGHSSIGAATGSMETSNCTLCGQCVTHCPVGALYERDDTITVLDALQDPDIITVIQIAPSIRAAWGEKFGVSREFATAERLVSALRAIGFDYIFDTDFTADLTIMEEGSEFVQRFTHPTESKLPMFTSCCPGWVRFVKSEYPDMVDNLSTAKSPQQMFGAVAKSYYAEILGVDPHKIFCVSVMPCTAKKHECAIPNLNDACGDPDVDAALTTREIDYLIDMFDIDVKSLEETPFDKPLGLSTGAGVIFGATGGVMEAALRSAYFLVTGENPDADAFHEVRGMDGWKEAQFDIAGNTVRVAVANGLGNTRKLMEAIRLGQVDYDFVEIMACPGGCVGGGGQPIHDGQELAGIRADRLYVLDKGAELRFSHENPAVLNLYEDYLEKPLSHKSHHLLHTDHHGWKMPNEQ
ncbi:MAG: NADH-dependent [FeFe] hydrogenase, group A6 [Oscillospiraceae bacterium]